MNPIPANEPGGDDPPSAASPGPAALSSEHRQAISTQLQAEEQLRESEQKHRTIYENVGSIITTVDRNGTIIDYNAHERVLGYDRVELLGKSVVCVIHRDDIDRARQALAVILGGGQTGDREYRLVRKDGQAIHAIIRATTLKDSHGQPRQAILVIEDITDRRNAEESSRKLQAELEHLSRLTTVGEMASSLAHELSQPLGAILNYAQVCRDALASVAHPPAALVEAIQEISRETERSGAIIRRLRAFLRKQDTRRELADLNTVVAEAVDLMRLDSRRHGLQFRLQCAAELPRVRLDAIQIQQVLVNLIRNGIDAMTSSPGSDRAIVIRTAGDESGGVVISVSDRGCGIAPEHRGRIFESFFTTKPDGLGMGLAICRSIIESHGGTLAFRANPGGGTTFEFTLPGSEDPG